MTALFLYIVIFYLITIIYPVHCDVPEKYQMNIQDPATPVLEGMISFHNFLVVFEIFIGVFVLWLLIVVIARFNNHSNPKPQVFTHSSTLEIYWTIVPAFVLGLLAIPSFALLYSLEEQIDPALTIKVVGHQWYWTYEYTDYLDLVNIFDKTENMNVEIEPSSLNSDNSLIFDSYMKATEELVKGSFRLLEVDNRAVLPIKTHIRVLVTSADVLHSWAVPSFGIKIDACPGRISQGFLFLKREGVYYGQCSEICGVNHGFMPIVVVGVSTKDFYVWILSRLNLDLSTVLSGNNESISETQEELISE